MKKIFFKTSAAVLTFCIGTAAFYLLSIQPTKNDEQIDNVAIVANNNPESEISTDDFDPWKLPDDFPPLKEGEFFPVGHGCGNGYVDGWLAYDGSRLSEGFNNISRKDFQKEIAKAERIIEKTENYPNKNGQKGLRIVLQGRNETTQKEYYSIFWFGKAFGKKYGMYFLDGPNLNIALELERKLIEDSKKAKSEN